MNNQARLNPVFFFVSWCLGGELSGQFTTKSQRGSPRILRKNRHSYPPQAYMQSHLIGHYSNLPLQDGHRCLMKDNFELTSCPW